MWLVAQKAILAKDNMLKKWKGNPGCYTFVDQMRLEHLLFCCPIAKVIWGFVAFWFQQNDRASSYEQFWPWIRKALPGGDRVYMPRSCCYLLGYFEG
jgi:hypothetical protein